MHAADQPCTLAIVDSDTAVVGPAFAEGKCILCCIDSDKNLRALTSVGIQSLIGNCNVTGMTHISEYFMQHTDVRHCIHQSCRLKTVKQACKARKAKTVSRDSAKVSAHSVTGAFSFQLMCFSEVSLWLR